MKAFFSHIHTALSKALNYPIPYWFTPFGIVLIAVTILAMNYGLNWKLNTESWPFWLWAMDKLITVGTIIGAALLAQHIFNENARKRENRERRLKRIESIFPVMDAIQAQKIEFDRSNSENYHKKMQPLVSELYKIKMYQTLYFENKTCVEELLDSIFKLSFEYRKYLSENEGYRTFHMSEFEGYSRMREPSTSSLILKLSNQLIEIHKEIENEH